MICKSCGKELNEIAMFCPDCGTAVAAEETPAPVPAMEEVPVPAAEEASVPVPPQYSPYPMPAPAKKSNKKTLIFAIAALASLIVLGVLIVALVLGGGGSYEKVIDQYFEALQNNDGELMFSLFPDEYDVLWEDYTHLELIDDLEYEMEWYTEDFGNFLSIQYEIVDATTEKDFDLDELDMTELALMSGFKEFAYVEVYYVIKGSEDRDSDEMSFLLAKTSKGDWRMLSDSLIFDLF